MNKTDNVRIVEMTGKNGELAGVSYEWDSYEEFLPDLKQIQEKKPHFMNSITSMSGDRWWGCSDGFHGVQRRVQNGWPELREQVLKMLKGIDLELPIFPTHATVRRRKTRHDDHGDSIDMTRVWNGQVDTAWARPVRVERQAPNTKRITLAFDVTANANVTNDMAMWRAALCTLLVDSLARAGRIMEIWVIDSTSNPFQWGQKAPPRLWSAWCVKKTNDPVVLDRLCAMVSVGFMRSAGFAAMGCGPWTASSGFGGALGTGLPYTLRERVKAKEVVLRIGQCYSRKQVIDEYRSAWEEVEAASKEAA